LLNAGLRRTPVVFRAGAVAGQSPSYTDYLQPESAMAQYWMGIDVGTGGTRALLTDAKGTVVAAESAAHEPIAMPEPLWAQQSADDWWSAAQRAVAAVLRSAKATPAEVRGIGLSGQMHGVVLLDEDNRVLGPSLIWCDQRTQAEVEAITTAVGAGRVIELTANPVLTGFSAPKILWERRHHPDRFRHARRFLLPKDYVRFRLTGDFATDVADASGTSLFDVRHRGWSRQMLAALDLPESFVPPAFEGPEVTGRVHADGARATGLVEGTPVVAGGGDQAAGAVGNGIVRAGIASATLGTSGVVFAATDEPLVDLGGRIHTFCHSVPGKWHVMGVTQGAGLSLRWFRDELGGPELADESETGVDAYDLLTREASHAPAGSLGLTWLPYLMGERTPHLDPLAKGGWIGITASHRRAHLIRSILEGVAYSLKDSLEIFASLGLHPSEIRLSGGGARGNVWPVIQAGVYGTRCVRIANLEGAAYGAALLAMVGTRHFQTVEDACDACIRIADEFASDPESQPAYSRGYAVYRELYPRLKELFGKMN
jgi:xylulokinase